MISHGITAWLQMDAEHEAQESKATINADSQDVAPQHAMLQQHSDEVAALSQQHSDEVATLLQQHSDEVAALSQQQSDEVAALSQQHSDEVAALSQQHSDDIAALQAQMVLLVSEFKVSKCCCQMTCVVSSCSHRHAKMLW